MPMKSSFSAIIRNRQFIPLLCLALTVVLLTVGPVTAPGAESFVRLHTDAGDILIAFDPELAPHHVDHFLHLARTGFFEGTSFHRIVPGFVIQGGDPNSKDADPRNDGQGGPLLRDVLTEEEYLHFDKLSQILAQKGYTSLSDQINIKAEFSPTAKHRRGVLSMARARARDSAGSPWLVPAPETVPAVSSLFVWPIVPTSMAATPFLGMSSPVWTSWMPSSPLQPPIRVARLLSNRSAFAR
jgi:cyclophilin family peptidyl-prolyl cis-trans isomerase